MQNPPTYIPTSCRAIWEFRSQIFTLANTRQVCMLTLMPLKSAGMKMLLTLIGVALCVVFVLCWLLLVPFMIAFWCYDRKAMASYGSHFAQ
jgi:hypothetical protein